MPLRRLRWLQRCVCLGRKATRLYASRPSRIPDGGSFTLRVPDFLRLDDSPLPVVTGIVDNVSPLGKQSSTLRVSPLQTPRPERHPSEVSEDEPVKDEELDRLRTSLLHAYDPPRPLTQRLAKAVKDRITLTKKANDKTAAVKKKGKDAA